MILATLSSNFMVFYRRQFGARVSPLACWRCLPLAQFGALFPSFVPSFRFTPSGRRGLLHGHRRGAGRQQHARALLPHGRRLWEGGWVLGVGVRTGCLLVLILSMNQEQKRMVLVASSVRDRRQTDKRHSVRSADSRTASGS